MDTNLPTYSRQRIIHMLSAQREARDWKLDDLALVNVRIDELVDELVRRETIDVGSNPPSILPGPVTYVNSGPQNRPRWHPNKDGTPVFGIPERY
jgi:hypothetical protein